MNTNRTKQYFAGKKGNSNQPIKKAEEIQKSNDNKIDQDFPGFPHGQSKENIINPVSQDDKKIADINNKDGEKVNYKNDIDEAASDGSGGAFDATEKVSE